MELILTMFLAMGLGLFCLPKKWSGINPFLIAGLQAFTVAFFAWKLPLVISGNAVYHTTPWLPHLGLNLGFVLDGLSMVFVLLVSFIGFLVFLYAKAYMKGYAGTTRFYFYLTVFSGAMLGLVLSSNFIQLFIFWELTSVLSFLLISFFNEKEASRKAAFQSLFITGFGGLSLLAGFLLLGSIVGSYSLQDWLAQSDAIKASDKYLPSLVLVLLGVFTKSAQFPFHFWLPGAMQAPTPVSSYLHSATMVKAGVFLLARLNPILGGTEEWTYIIPVAGVLTMIVGSYLSITQTDIKATLAYTTISALGVLVLLFGIDTVMSVKAAFVFLFVHAFYKAALFMIAGYIEKKTGTRDIDQLGGLLYYMPLGFVVSLIAFFSMAGLPPMIGFIGKELIYEAKVQSPGLGFTILILGMLSNVFMVAVSLLLLVKVFMGKPRTFIKQNGLNDGFFLLGPAILAILSLGLGLFPNVLSKVIQPAMDVVRDNNVYVKLKLWHGFNEVFFLSVLTVVGGLVMFIAIHRKNQLLLAWRKLNDRLFSIKFADVFSNFINGFVVVSQKNTRFIQHGYHRFYILTIVVFTASILLIQLYIGRGWQLETALTFKPFYISGLLAIIVTAVVFSAFSGSRLSTIIAMGVSGYGIALIFLYYSAVDLAITQIIVETLTVVMFVLVLQKMPKFALLSGRTSRIRDASIALVFGGIMTVLALRAIQVDLNRPISGYFIENSYLKAYGKNVVNVILVDFRALDTLGEITVLTIAAVGVFVLLNRKTLKK